MERKPRSYRFSDAVIQEIQELTKLLSVSETEAVTRAVHFYLSFIKNEDEMIQQRAVVSLSEYQAMQQRLQNQLTQVLYRVGILEGENREKQNQLMDKEKQIQNLQETINKLLEAQKQAKPWWQFWKKEGR